MPWGGWGRQLDEDPMPPDTPSESEEFGLALEVLQSWRTDFGGQSPSAGQFGVCMAGWKKALAGPHLSSPKLSAEGN